MNQNLVSTEQYAKLAGVSPQAVRDRIYKGKIAAIYIKEKVIRIDLLRYPIIHKIKKSGGTGRPKSSK